VKRRLVLLYPNKHHFGKSSITTGHLKWKLNVAGVNCIILDDEPHAIECAETVRGAGHLRFAIEGNFPQSAQGNYFSPARIR